MTGKGVTMYLRVVGLLFAIGLIASACGGSESESGVATLESEDTVVGEPQSIGDESGEVDAEEAMMDLAACLHDQGLDIEDPTVDADGNVQFGGFRGEQSEDGEPAVDRDQMRAAMDECQDQLEGVALGFGGRGLDLTDLQDDMVEYAACMRENGYDMDDPDLSAFGGGPGEGGGGGGPFGEIDQDDPDFVAANESCGDILAGIPGPGAGRPNAGRGTG